MRWLLVVVLVVFVALLLMQATSDPCAKYQKGTFDYYVCRGR